MDKNMINKTIRISAYLSIIIFLIFYLTESNNVNYLAIISKSVSIVTLFWLFYFKYGWKIIILKKIFDIPNLNGTWTGTLQSDWRDESGNGVGALEFYIVIKQNFLNFHIKTFTENYAGKSYIEKIDFNEKEGEVNLAYFYCADIISTEEDTRQGVVELRVLNETLGLSGKYWTRNKTCGTIHVTFNQKKHFSTYEVIKRMCRGDK
ncbi:hypothetical protein [Paenibacillus sp. V4I7]|uniref:Cap15 family cyclic dinucleotide receptor domain-containing protein n=1 Tax=Paenibacillus sp. V4I7 TaxID=3042307 RepID=UPI0027862709|nr:hypothetical protein [Paenibacillus sp. V4I7]MDQ0897503.1 hypothetical protein [Paenibacillus sp. V4I7]